MAVAREAIAGEYNRAKELKEFDQTMAGVKGLVDSGLLKVPRIFIQAPVNVPEDSAKTNLQLPVIDLNGLERSERRAEIVEQIREASERWGFFQMINHGVPASVMDGLLDASKRFHEQPTEKKTEFYSRDLTKKVRLNSNGDLFLSTAASWRDTLTCIFEDGILDPESLPMICRKEIDEYMKCMIKLRTILSELLSEALGLSSDYLSRMECMESELFTCHYYPACPEPELTVGIPKHCDVSFLTILLQDNIGGLQVLHQNQWVDVHPMPGALVANLGELMQFITNDKFKSVEHRVLARPVTRLSAALLFTPSMNSRNNKLYGPLKELISDNNPPVYRDIVAKEYFDNFQLGGSDGGSNLSRFKLQ